MERVNSGGGRIEVRRWSSCGMAMALTSLLGCGGEPAPATVAAQSAVAASAAGGHALSPGTKFAVRPPDAAARTQVAALARSRKLVDAARLAAMEAAPQAFWFTDGSPKEVEAAVRKVMHDAATFDRVPVLVAYNVPYRDCSGYSAGGASDTAGYRAWIDGFTRGIGKGRAVVLLEPDSLGIIPYNTTLAGGADWCQPTVTDGAGNVAPAPGSSSAERYAQLTYAVDRLEAGAPRAAVYLDGTHSAWLGIAEAAYRLVTAGVQRAQGFFLNVSNFQTTADNTQFGTWVSDCITAATAGAPAARGHFDQCPSQYDPATGYTTVNYSPAFAANVTASLQRLMNGACASTRFVIDTSRNGQGAWTPAATYPDPQNWCNPPGRGAGPRPTASTGVALLDAYLWVKVPGESDGSCNRGVPGSTTDPAWGGIVDPDAGAWFTQQALQLASLANPPLL